MGMLSPTLTTLNLTASSLQKEHVSMLATNLKRLTNLNELILDNNSLSPVAVMSILDACPASLETLSLVGMWSFLSPIPTPTDMSNFTKHRPRVRKKLNLGQNKLTDGHVVTMRNDWPETLDLSANAIEDASAEYLARFVLATLKAMNLFGNHITKGGAGVLAEVMEGKTKACKVNLTGNLVMDQQRQVLKSKYPGVAF